VILHLKKSFMSNSQHYNLILYVSNYGTDQIKSNHAFRDLLHPHNKILVIYSFFLISKIALFFKLLLFVCWIDVELLEISFTIPLIFSSYLDEMYSWNNLFLTVSTQNILVLYILITIKYNRRCILMCIWV